MDDGLRQRIKEVLDRPNDSEQQIKAMVSITLPILRQIHSETQDKKLGQVIAVLEIATNDRATRLVWGCC
jgi:hypothetical protein